MIYTGMVSGFAIEHRFTPQTPRARGLTMGFWQIWDRLRGVRPPEPAPTRLSADQAIQIARAAVEDDFTRDLLTITTVDERNGALVWTVSEAVMGRATHVEVDDGTGQVLKVFATGVR